MKLFTNQVNSSVWCMEIQYDREEQMQAIWYTLSNGKEIKKSENPHDHRVSIVEKELNNWNGIMWSRVSYSAWYWMDKDEMDAFVTYLLLKHTDF